VGLPSYAQIDRPTDLGAVFRGPDYLKWRAFRDTDDSRFVGLTLPRVLMRTPYGDDNSRADGFRFREDVEGPDNSKYLWGNASYAFGAVLIRSFCESGWLADIRGFQRDIVTGGLVSGLPVHSFGTDKTGVATKTSTDVAIGDLREKELGDLGFIPLCHCKDTDYCVFYGNQSAQKPKIYDTMIASTNARISAMLQYILCASRFAHYLKVRVRDRIGSLTDEVVIQTELRNWITQYVANDSQASPEVRARYPLREAEVRVYPKRDNPGVYGCEMHLMPHAQLDMLAVGVKLTMAELSRTRR
jgi:type VI secretion system ImpC/EvpB family protein